MCDRFYATLVSNKHCFSPCEVGFLTEDDRKRCISPANKLGYYLLPQSSGHKNSVVLIFAYQSSFQVFCEAIAEGKGFEGSWKMCEQGQRPPITLGFM